MKLIYHSIKAKTEVTSSRRIKKLKTANSALVRSENWDKEERRAKILTKSDRSIDTLIGVIL